MGKLGKTHRESTEESTAVAPLQILICCQTMVSSYFKFQITLQQYNRSVPQFLWNGGN